MGCSCREFLVSSRLSKDNLLLGSFFWGVGPPPISSRLFGNPPYDLPHHWTPAPANRPLDSPLEFLVFWDPPTGDRPSQNSPFWVGLGWAAHCLASPSASFVVIPVLTICLAGALPHQEPHRLVDPALGLLGGWLPFLPRVSGFIRCCLLGPGLLPSPALRFGGWWHSSFHPGSFNRERVVEVLFHVDHVVVPAHV